MKKPTKIKEMQGTLNSTRVLVDEFTPTLLLAVPLPPEHYADKVKNTWYKVANELLDAGILYSIDMDLLEAYCDAFEIQQKCLEDINLVGIKQGGKFGDVANPSMVQFAQMTKLMLSIGANLGIGPANRTKIGGANKKQKDPLSTLLSKKPKNL